MLRIGVSGAAGRMGRRLVALVREADDLELVCSLESDGHDALGRDAGEVAGTGHIGVAVGTALAPAPDVLIDFTAPGPTVARARACADAGVRMVAGTTGMTDGQVEALRDAARQVAILFAPNMSVGVCVLSKLVREAAAALGDDYDVEIIETHHRFKRDAPSGTAKKLARAAADGLGRNLGECGVYGREGLVGERTRTEIGMHAVRAGDVVGEHTVLFGALGERIELRHVAQTRDTFARGALRAARFIADKPPGLYAMEDVLGDQQRY
jgi:4-hydroxy-tetrahydrodipicolinate reductase